MDRETGQEDVSDRLMLWLQEAVNVRRSLLLMLFAAACVLACVLPLSLLSLLSLSLCVLCVFVCPPLPPPLISPLLPHSLFTIIITDIRDLWTLML
jgi:Na+/proline symporter